MRDAADVSRKPRSTISSAERPRGLTTDCVIAKPKPALLDAPPSAKWY
jgi:hypothetical protein